MTLNRDYATLDFDTLAAATLAFPTSAVANRARLAHESGDLFGAHILWTRFQIGAREMFDDFDSRLAQGRADLLAKRAEREREARNTATALAEIDSATFDAQDAQEREDGALKRTPRERAFLRWSSGMDLGR